MDSYIWAHRVHDAGGVTTGGQETAPSLCRMARDVLLARATVAPTGGIGDVAVVALSVFGTHDGLDGLYDAPPRGAGLSGSPPPPMGGEGGYNRNLGTQSHNRPSCELGQGFKMGLPRGRAETVSTVTFFDCGEEGAGL